ncbi:hypothetical protein AQY21_15905 [Paracoccus sp. MKU1]|nr:hypothetical protein AQY21_15905 [Paracoccus sp. MKU1]
MLGKPMQNGFAESFNGRMRDELLNETMFRNLAHARVEIAAWVTDYNTECLHSALGYQTPIDYPNMWLTAFTTGWRFDIRRAHPATSRAGR